MRKRRAILHIGTEKTGSTTIQRVMANSREALLRHGFAYPLSPGARNHLRLALAAGERGANRALTRQALEPGGPEAVAASFPRRLARELAALPDGVHTVVFSNEHCHSRLRTPESVRRLRDLLAPFFDEVRVLVYLRRQDEVAVSLYSTQVRGDAFTRRELLPDPQRMRDYFDYAAMLDRYAAAFGAAALAPRIFDRAAFAGGDLTRDFLAACGIPAAAVEVPEGMARSNQSLRPAAQEFLRRLNETGIALDGRPGAAGGKRLPMQRVIGGDHSGTGRLPARADAAAFLGAFAEGNERVRAAFFPDRPTLFGTDLSRYPETEDEAAIADGPVLEVALRVVHALNDEARVQRMHLLSLSGRLQAEAGDPDAARHTFMAALRLVPTDPRCVQGLARLALDEDSADLARAHLRRAAAGDAGNPLWAEVAARIEAWPERAARAAAGGSLRAEFAAEGLASVVADALAEPEDDASEEGGEERGDGARGAARPGGGPGRKDGAGRPAPGAPGPRVPAEELRRRRDGGQQSRRGEAERLGAVGSGAGGRGA